MIEYNEVKSKVKELLSGLVVNFVNQQTFIRLEGISLPLRRIIRRKVIRNIRLCQKNNFKKYFEGKEKMNREIKNYLRMKKNLLSKIDLDKMEYSENMLSTLREEIFDIRKISDL